MTRACTPHGVGIAVVALLTRAGHGAIENGEGADSTVVVYAVCNIALGKSAGSLAANPSSHFSLFVDAVACVNGARNL
jgi:hypothetical protein